MNIESLRAKFTWGKEVLLLLVLFLLINILILDIKVFTSKEDEEVVVPAPSASPLESATASPDIQEEESDICPAACLEAIESATVSLPQATLAPVTTTPQAAVKEIYIPLGSGSTKSTTYVELGGIESVVDMDNYPNVKEIIFEATLRIPTANGKVYAKLYNVTDKHDAWYSEVWAEGSSGYRAESGNVVLAPGRKVYRVMMRSTMGFEAILDNARIKILLK